MFMPKEFPMLSKLPDVGEITSLMNFKQNRRNFLLH